MVDIPEEDDLINALKRYNEKDPNYDVAIAAFVDAEVAAAADQGFHDPAQAQLIFTEHEAYCYTGDGASVAALVDMLNQIPVGDTFRVILSPTAIV